MHFHMYYVKMSYFLSHRSYLTFVNGNKIYLSTSTLVLVFNLCQCFLSRMPNSCTHSKYAHIDDDSQGGSHLSMHPWTMEVGIKHPQSGFWMLCESCNSYIMLQIIDMVNSTLPLIDNKVLTEDEPQFISRQYLHLCMITVIIRGQVPK